MDDGRLSTTVILSFLYLFLITLVFLWDGMGLGWEYPISEHACMVGKMKEGTEFLVSAICSTYERYYLCII